MAFPDAVALKLQKRARHLCAICRQHTSGPTGTTEAHMIGEAAHIRGEKLNSARYDAAQDPGERQSVVNGIWLCNGCHKKVDDDKRATVYTVEFLTGCKNQSERNEVTPQELNPAQTALQSSLKELLIVWNQIVPNLYGDSAALFSTMNKVRRWLDNYLGQEEFIHEIQKALLAVNMQHEMRRSHELAEAKRLRMVEILAISNLIKDEIRNPKLR